MDRVPTVIRWRRPWGPVAGTVVVVVLVCGGVAAVARYDTGSEPTPSGSASGQEGSWRWAAYRDVEVKVPASWKNNYESARPDCIPRSATGPGKNTGGSDAPTAPYVAYGDAPRVVAAMGCRQERKPDDPDPVFGALPFALWEPYVKFDQPRPDLTVKGQYPDHEDAALSYRGWRLTRTTTHGIQITVLSAPGKSGLARAVLDSIRTVQTTHLGCPTASTVLAHHPTAPTGAPLPRAEEIGAVTVCDYQRGHADLRPQWLAPHRGP